MVCQVSVVLGYETVKKRAKGQRFFGYMVRGGISLVRSSKVVAERAIHAVGGEVLPTYNTYVG